MLDETVIDGIRDEYLENSVSQDVKNGASNNSVLETLVKAYGTGGGALTLDQNDEPLKEKLSLERAKLLFEDEVRLENALTPVSFIYEFSIYEKEEIPTSEMVGSLRETRGEIATILNSYTPDMYRVLGDNMTLQGGWQELIKKGCEKSGDIGFGKAIQKYINLRISSLDSEYKDLRLTPNDRADKRSLMESFIKTASFVSRGMPK